MTKREHMPIDFDPRLNRVQAPPLGCVRMLVALLVLVVLIALVGFGIAAARRPDTTEMIPTVAVVPSATVTETPSTTPTSEATATPSATATLDAWSATGTALAGATISPTPTASPTLDYCWWLTPTATPTPTLAYTPDAWQATGTAIYEATNPYQTPTPPPPRELCIEYASLLEITTSQLSGELTEEATEATELIFVTATLTPFPLPRFDSNTQSQAATNTAFLMSRAESTQEARAASVGGGGGVRTVVVTAPPERIEVVITSAPQIIVQTSPPQVIVATNAPNVPTVTRNAEWFASATAYFGTVSPIMTETASYVLTLYAPTATPSATVTIEGQPSAEPTQDVTATIEMSATVETTQEATATATLEPTQTATELPSATPTVEPTFTLIPSPTLDELPTTEEASQ